MASQLDPDVVDDASHEVPVPEVVVDQPTQPHSEVTQSSLTPVSASLSSKAAEKGFPTSPPCKRFKCLASKRDPKKSCRRILQKGQATSSTTN